MFGVGEVYGTSSPKTGRALRKKDYHDFLILKICFVNVKGVKEMLSVWFLCGGVCRGVCVADERLLS
jgi:hypothetical protein